MATAEGVISARLEILSSSAKWRSNNGKQVNGLERLRLGQIVRCATWQARHRLEVPVDAMRPGPEATPSADVSRDLKSECTHLNSLDRPFDGLAFMVVDDSIDMGVMLERVIRKRAARQVWRETCVKSSMSSVKNKQTCPDAIISDYNMKPLTGLQFLQAVRVGVNPLIPRDIPFILISGHGEMEVVKCAQELDASGYILKPSSIKRIEDVISAALKKRLTLRDPSFYKTVQLPTKQTLAKLSEA
jgi:DNA-binding NarL/FixJ family response regulator